MTGWLADITLTMACARSLSIAATACRPISASAAMSAEIGSAASNCGFPVAPRGEPVMVVARGKSGLERSGAGVGASHEPFGVQRDATCHEAVGRRYVGQFVELLRRRRSPL